MLKPFLRVVLPLLWLAVVVVTAAGVAGLRFDSDAWLAPEHPLEQQLDHVADEFEEGETLLLIIPLQNPFFSTPDIFPALQALEERLLDIPGVLDSRSPLSAKTVVSADGLQVRSFANALEVGAFKSIDELQAAFRQSPYAGRILSADGKTLAIRLRTDTRNRAVLREEVMRAVEGEVGDSRFAGAVLSGDTALKTEINRAVRDQLPVLLGLGALVVFVFLYAFLRHGYQVATLMICLGVAVAQSLTVINLLGHSLTPVSIALPLLVCIIVIADGLHILAIWDRESASGASNPLRATMAKTWLPCLMTSLTSAIGFGAFFVSELLPVRNFGFDSMLAIALCYPWLIATVWGALALFPAKMAARPKRQTATVAGAVLAALARRKKAAPVFGLAALALALSLLGAHAETNFLYVLFKESSPVAKAFAVTDRRLGGSGSIEVLIDGGQEEFFKSIDNFNRVKALASAMSAHEYVSHADSYVLPLRVTHHALSDDGSLLPRNSDELAQEIFFLELSRGEQGRDLLGPYLNFPAATARLEAQTPNLVSSKLDSVITFLSLRAREAFPEAQVTITGSGHYAHQLSRYVISTQTSSFLLTLGVIAVVFFALFGLRLGAAGFVCNLFPVLAATGALCLLRVPFDFATVLVAGVTLGLSVDDSIHFLHHYKRERTLATDTQTALEHAMRIVARPIVITSMLFCLGLAVFLSSSLVVMIKFAIFTIIGLVAAMLSAVVLLPWLVEVFAGRAPRPATAARG